MSGERPRHSLARDTIEILLAAAIVFVFTRAFLFEQASIDSGSMEHTLQAGDYLLVDRSVFAPVAGDWERRVRATRPLERGDVIVFRHPQRPELKYIKRLIGLPGDWVEIRAGTVFVNGRPLDEPYVAERFRNPYQYVAPQRVRPGALFVLGDHRNDSFDSEEWGQVPREHVLGRGVLIWWSFARPSGGRSALERGLDRLSFGLARTRRDRCLKLIE